jgi:hypothetical protein
MLRAFFPHRHFGYGGFLCGLGDLGGEKSGFIPMVLNEEREAR